MAGNGLETPDPVSVQFEDRAARLLERAYAAGGAWVTTRLADPPPSLAARWAGEGIDVTAADPQPGRECRTRWARAFARAVYRTHKWHYRGPVRGLSATRRTTPSGTPVQVEVGRHLAAVGIIPAGRSIRVRVLKGGRAKDRAVRRLASADRIYTESGGLAARWADPQKRDWA